MKVSFYLPEDRAKFLLKALGPKIKVLSIDEYWLVEMTINHGSDALDIFHAGIDFGFLKVENILR